MGEWYDQVTMYLAGPVWAMSNLDARGMRWAVAVAASQPTFKLAS
jgi:hypothetical protein